MSELFFGLFKLVTTPLAYISSVVLVIVMGIADCIVGILELTSALFKIISDHCGSLLGCQCQLLDESGLDKYYEGIEEEGKGND